MFKRFGLKTLALAAGLAIAAPVITLARDHDDDRGRGYSRQENFRGDRGGRDFHDRGFRDRGWGHRDFDDDDGGRWGVGFGYYSAPAPVPVPAPAVNGYYDQYGNWQPAYGQQGYYQQYPDQQYPNQPYPNQSYYRR